MRWEIVPGGPSVGNEDVLHVFIGEGTVWDTITDAVNFMRTVLTEERMSPLLGAWLPGNEESEKPSASIGCGSNCGSSCPSQNQQPAAPAALNEQPLLAMSPLDTSELVKVLRGRQIKSWYQPVFHSGTHELWGHECLMRAYAQDGSMIYPSTLLDWATQEHLIFMLDRVCRETHISNAAAAIPGDTAILINFLPTAIYDPSFCLRTTRAAAKRSGLDPSRVIFEVVESEQVSEMKHLRNILDYYREAGFRCALDDVGAGYAGLTMLAELSPDLIKIDRELVIQAPASKMHRIICNALVQIAHQSDKLCLAEGIETAEEYDVMRGIGVDLVQGYYFGKPAADPAFTTEVPAVAAKPNRNTRSHAAA